MALPSFISTVAPTWTKEVSRWTFPYPTTTCLAKGSRRGGRSKSKRLRGSDSREASSVERIESQNVPASIDRGGSEEEEARDREMLRRDVAAFRARNKPDEDEDAITVVSDTYELAKKIFDNFLLFDFFLVVGLLGWLVLALIPHFAAKNDVLLDPWLALWQPFIQPVLGVLMLATIGQGMLTYMFSNGD